MRTGRDGDALGGVRLLFGAGTLVGLDDAQLIDIFLRRDREAAEAAFAALVQRHGPAVLRVCRAASGGAADAEDAFQATFLVLAARAASVRHRRSVASWLHGVALRIASVIRRAEARRRRREAAVAATRSRVVEASTPDDAPVVHEELARLAERHRAPILLCDLDGLSHEEAALRLGWPLGTLKSRLARGRVRLRAALIRRGIAPAIVTVGAVSAARGAAGEVPRGLCDETVRRALQVAAGAGLPAGGIKALVEGVLAAMIVTRLKRVGLIVAAVGVAFAGWMAQAGDGRQDRPGGGGAGIRHVDRLDFGELRRGAAAEGGLGVTFSGVEQRGLAVQVEPPGFATVKHLRVFPRKGRNEGDVACILTLTLDTGAVGELAGELKVRLGDREATVPVSATVTPREDDPPRVLVIDAGFPSASDEAAYYRPWFDLIERERLDVSYMDPFGSLGLAESLRGPDEVPEELSRYDTIVAQCSDVLSESDIYFLQRFAESGGRLVVLASDGHSGSAAAADRLAEPFGLRVRSGRIAGRKAEKVPAARIAGDPLTAGVQSLGFFRPAVAEVADEERGKILAAVGGRGVVAVSRPGRGEVIFVGTTLLPSWIGEEDYAGTDNVRLLANLLRYRRRVE